MNHRDRCHNYADGWGGQRARCGRPSMLIVTVEHSLVPPGNTPSLIVRSLAICRCVVRRNPRRRRRHRRSPPPAPRQAPRRPRRRPPAANARARPPGPHAALASLTSHCDSGWGFQSEVHGERADVHGQGADAHGRFVYGTQDTYTPLMRGSLAPTGSMTCIGELVSGTGIAEVPCRGRRGLGGSWLSSMRPGGPLAEILDRQHQNAQAWSLSMRLSAGRTR